MRHDRATPRRGDIVAAWACTVGKRCASMRSHPVTPGSTAPGFLSWRLGLNYDPWSRTLANTLRRLTLCPDPKSRSAFLPLPAFPSNFPESYDFWEDRKRERERSMYAKGPVLSPLSQSIVFFVKSKISLFFFAKITLLLTIFFLYLNKLARLDIIILRHTPSSLLARIL